MRAVRTFLPVIMLGLSGCNPPTPFTLLAGTQAESATGTVRALASVGGRSVVLTNAVLVNPDCSSAGTAHFTITRQPQHGTLKIESGEYYPSYPSSDPNRYACNVRKHPGILVRYIPQPGYTGEDFTAISAIAPSGNMATADYRISVTP
ncbi:hypothetical protein LOC54_01490 [Acetobacter sp. AN02]|uniref:hypothetical protein n=1 Tax=Acetobacter sp. AN02 TaxID=2894186 RepID=UPI0024343EDD|nr:hypothetical protein [Acetobacter sp. AN02]MDG6093795.1 hypothetical protein [Acetobacter sp. AN02]